MFCPNCGSKLRGDARFCSVCGSPVHAEQSPDDPSVTEPEPKDKQADGGAAAAPGASEPTPEEAAASEGPSAADGEQSPCVEQFSAQEEPSTFAGQVKKARKKSRRRVPMVLIVILVTLALAATAFAATYIYQHYFSPERNQDTSQVQTASVGYINEELLAPGIAESQKVSDEQKQKAVFAPLLSDMHDASVNGWSNDPSSGHKQETLDLADAMSRQGAQLYYAFVDLGNDGVLDLVVGVNDFAWNYETSSMDVLGIYLSNGESYSDAYSGMYLLRGAGAAVLDDGTWVEKSGTSLHGGVSINTCVNGAPKILDTYVHMGDESIPYKKNGEPISEEDYRSAGSDTLARNINDSLEWNPVSDYSSQ